MPKNQHIRNYKRTIQYIAKHLKRHKARLCVAFFFLFLTQIASRLSEAFLLMYVVDTITTATPSSQIANQLFTYIFIYIFIQLANLVISRISYILSTYAYSDLHGSVYKDSFHKINTLSYSFFQDNMSGSILAKIKRLASNAESILQTFNYNIFKTIVTLGMTITALSLQSLPIGVALLSFTILYTIITTMITSKLSDVYSKPAEQHSLLTGQLADNLTNILTVKTFGRSATEETNFNKITNKFSKLIYKKSSITEIINGIQVFLMIIIEFIVWTILINGWQNGTITAGDIVFVQTLLLASFHKLWGIGHALLSINNSVYDAKEMLDIFEKDSSLNISKNPIKNFQIKNGEINIKNLHFKYNKDSKVFQDLSLQIPKGQKVGIVGHSGSGKSTLIKLLLRLMDPLKGSINFDNQNIQDLEVDNFRSQISYVPQQPMLFHRSIAENIAYAKPGATKEEIIAVAKKAHAHEFISRLPNSYDSLVGERGVKLSGGERQRIAIARAMLEPNKILILDEATSALDSISEQFIQDSFQKLMQNRTTIVIAHRLSTIQQLDRILVMKDGQIIEDGTHTDLLNLKGEYHNLWSHQNNGFINE